MVTSKPIKVKGQPIGEGKTPSIIVPLIGKTSDMVLAELNQVLGKRPDVIEWRADFFADIGKTDAVVELARRVKTVAGDTPLLFTIRSTEEGGQKISLTSDQVVELYSVVCRHRVADIVDYELGNAPERVDRVRSISKETDTTMIMSYHNFQDTPSWTVLTQKFGEAAKRGADIAKVAVMPKNLHDVLTLLAATLDANEALPIPLISMSMGAHGLPTRLFGWVFGSAATFAVGANSSAPGQIPIEALRQAAEVMRSGMIDE